MILRRITHIDNLVSDLLQFPIFRSVAIQVLCVGLRLQLRIFFGLKVGLTCHHMVVVLIVELNIKVRLVLNLTIRSFPKIKRHLLQLNLVVLTFQATLI